MSQHGDTQSEVDNSSTQPPITEEDVRDFAGQIMMLMRPVSWCMVFVVVLVHALGQSDNSGFSGVLVYQEQESDTSGTKFAGALVNMLIFIALICGVTTLMVLLYKLRCMKLIYGWLILSCASLLGLFTMYIALRLLELHNVALDSISFYFLLWNFAVVGVVGIFWHCPLFIRQVYLVLMSSMMAWTLTKLPEWTTWGILTGVSLWDLFAVLSPVGPLKALLKESRDRDEPIPGLIYETSQNTLLHHAQQRPLPPPPPPPHNNNHNNQQQQQTQSRDEEERGRERRGGGRGGGRAHVTAPGGYELLLFMTAEETSASPPRVGRSETYQTTTNDVQQIEYEEDHSVKLGLGDFIFYSVLVARAAMLDTWPTVVTCFVALLTGLCLTLFFLAWTQRPLPALPISIGLGIVFYFATAKMVDPFLADLLKNQVFL